MARRACAAGLVALASVSGGQPTAAQPFVVDEPKAVQAAESLFQDVQGLARLVTPCVDSGQGTPAQCACRFRAQLNQVQRSARSVEARYPGWRGKVVNWTDPASRQSRAISLEAVLRQSALECPA